MRKQVFAAPGKTDGAGRTAGGARTLRSGGPPRSGHNTPTSAAIDRMPNGDPAEAILWGTPVREAESRR